MGKKLVTAQAPFTMLVPGIVASQDPSMTPGTIASKSAVDNGTPLAAAPVGRSGSGAAYRSQYFLDVPGKGPDTQPTSGKTPGTGTRMGLMAWETGTTPLPGRVDITCTAITFTGPTFIQFGQYRVEVGVDFAIGVNVADCADNLATYINACPGWSSAVSGTGTIRANGPEGIVGNEVEVYTTGNNPGLFTLATIGGAESDGHLQDADPTIGPPTTTPLS